MITIHISVAVRVHQKNVFSMSLNRFISYGSQFSVGLMYIFEDRSMIDSSVLRYSLAGFMGQRIIGILRCF